MTLADETLPTPYPVTPPRHLDDASCLRPIGKRTPEAESD